MPHTQPLSGPDLNSQVFWETRCLHGRVRFMMMVLTTTTIMIIIHLQGKEAQAPVLADFQTALIKNEENQMKSYLWSIGIYFLSTTLSREALSLSNKEGFLASSFSLPPVSATPQSTSPRKKGERDK